MQSDSHFRRNVWIVAAIHVLGLAAFFFVTRRHREAPHNDVTWLDGGGLAAASQSASSQPSEPAEPAEKPEPMPEKIAPPKPEPPPVPPKNETPSEIATVPKATPLPLPTPLPISTPKPKLTPAPTPKITLKPTPKPTAKPSPKKSPKPKASASPKKSGSPKPSAKPSASPHKKSDDGDSAEATEAKKNFLKSKGDGTAETSGDKGTKAGTGGGNRGGAGKTGGGNRESDFGWYYSMIHDRFYGRWEQPTSIISADQKYVTTVKIRIEKNGAISNVSLAKSSGNVIMDDSVMAAARRVSKIEPLPAGLGGEFFEINVNFELSQSQ